MEVVLFDNLPAPIVRVLPAPIMQVAPAPIVQVDLAVSPCSAGRSVSYQGLIIKVNNNRTERGEIIIKPKANLRKKRLPPLGALLLFFMFYRESA